MTDLDQLLQDALDAAADRVPMSDGAWIHNEELLHTRRSHRTRTAVVLSSAAAAVVAIVVAVAVWAVPGQRSNIPATGASDKQAPATTGTLPPTPHPSATASAPGSTQSTPDSGIVSSPGSTSAINEPADDSVRTLLLQAFTAYRSQPDHPKDMGSIPPTAIAGFTKGSLYYAYVPGTDTYWAKATFDATPEAKKGSDYIGFQDGGNTAVFSRTAEGAWTVEYVGPCDRGLPPEVVQLWSLPSHADDPLCN